MWIMDGKSILYNIDLDKIEKIVPFLEKETPTLTLFYAGKDPVTLSFKSLQERDNDLIRISKHLNDYNLLI